MNRYLKNLNRIEFVVTMACSGRCKHCSQGSHISNEHIDAEIAEHAIYDICRYYKIESLMTFGGEPLLYPEAVRTIHSAARKMNIPQRELITNGYFSKDINRIKEVAHMLAQSGVNGICLSVDAFHQETIPIEYVKEFAKAVIEENISIHTHPAWLVGADDDNPYNQKTRELLNEFSTMGIEQSSGNVIFPSGNALKYLGEYFDKNIEYHNPYRENPKDVKTISFSANGDVLGGNIYKNSILEIIENYRRSDMELVKGRPACIEGRLEKEIRVYDFLDSLGIEYYRTDHGEANTMEVCREIDKILDTVICKNLFLCNRQKTEFYLLMMPGDKPFKTKDITKQIGCSRLSFADAEYMEKLLDIKPGAVSIMGLMNDKENRVQLLIDRPVVECETLGCHPCVSTSSLKFKTIDILEKYLPAVNHKPIIVDMPNYEEANDD